MLPMPAGMAFHQIAASQPGSSPLGMMSEKNPMLAGLHRWLGMPLGRRRGSHGFAPPRQTAISWKLSGAAAGIGMSSPMNRSFSDSAKVGWAKMASRIAV